MHDNISTQFSPQNLNVIVLTEQQVQVYYVIQKKCKKPLIEEGNIPEIVFLPFTTGHCSEILIDEIYVSIPQAPLPRLFQVCSVNTVEDTLLQYKQHMSHLGLQEVNEFVEQYQLEDPKPWEKPG